MIDFPLRNKEFVFRLVDVDDAEFILSLRTDENLSKFLSKTKNDIHEQQKWIKKYKEREKQGQEYYIICVDESKNEKLGLYRIYNLSEKGFETGSWLFKSKTNSNISVFTDLFLRNIFFSKFGYEHCFFEVIKGNDKVLKYHMMFRPMLIEEDGKRLYFKLSRENFEKHKNKLIKIMGYE